MDSALNVALERARREGAEQIYSIRLRVGKLSGVAPDALRFAFDALAIGTPAAGARLEIEEIPARFQCDRCHKPYPAESLTEKCPFCHSTGTLMQLGRDLELASLEVE